MNRNSISEGAIDAAAKRPNFLQEKIDKSARRIASNLLANARKTKLPKEKNKKTSAPYGGKVKDTVDVEAKNRLTSYVEHAGHTGAQGKVMLV